MYKFSSNQCTIILTYAYISQPWNSKNVQAAMSIEPWKEAMKNKMRTLEKNNVWEMVSLPKGKEQLGANEFSLLNVELMVHWRSTRQDL